jgi:putative hydrolase of the HAD superfamily
MSTSFSFKGLITSRAGHAFFYSRPRLGRTTVAQDRHPGTGLRVIPRAIYFDMEWRVPQAVSATSVATILQLESRMVRNVIFDLGGVVLDWNPDRLVSRFQPDATLQSAFKAALFGHDDWKAFDRGQLTEPDLIDRLESRLGLARSEVIALLDATRHSLVEKPDTVKLIRDLEKRRVPLYCLSNMPAAVYVHLQRQHTFWDAFKGIVISGEVKMMKPEPEVFLHLLETFNLSAAESVFIDDVIVNIEAAKRVGLHAILFKDAGQCREELDRLLAA